MGGRIAIAQSRAWYGLGPQAHTARMAAPNLAQALQQHLERRTGKPVALKETHISWVLLTQRLAFKLKKPVKLPFLDFSTPALRQRCCEEELRLNRRLAPTIYRAVVPVRGSALAPRLGGGGEVIDHALCMRRFPDGALLSERLAAGTLAPELLDQLAARIARFHRDASAQPPDASHGTPERIVHTVRTVLLQLAPGLEHAPSHWLARWVETQAAALHDTWLQRRAQGFVRECHGDLHLANAVCLDREVTAFDCIEFDPALRWIDTMSELGFLTMDLKAHGRPDLAWRFLDGALQASGDFAGLRVLRFYEVYRALVRALVAQIAARGGGMEAGGPDYLGCAQALAREAATPPRLAILFGMSGSGKSTLALQLLQAAGAVRVRSDVERKRLFGLDALQSSAGVDIYTPEATARTYARLAECARSALAGGTSVIVDAAFLRRGERDALRSLAAQMNAPFSIIACKADAAVLRRRVAARAAAGGDASEADLRVLQRQLDTHEPLAPQELQRTIAVSTAAAVDIVALARQWMHA